MFHGKLCCSTYPKGVGVEKFVGKACHSEALFEVFGDVFSGQGFTLATEKDGSWFLTS